MDYDEKEYKFGFDKGPVISKFIHNFPVLIEYYTEKLQGALIIMNESNPEVRRVATGLLENINGLLTIYNEYTEGELTDEDFENAVIPKKTMILGYERYLEEQFPVEFAIYKSTVRNVVDNSSIVLYKGRKGASIPEVVNRELNTRAPSIVYNIKRPYKEKYKTKVMRPKFDVDEFISDEYDFVPQRKSVSVMEKIPIQPTKILRPQKAVVKTIRAEKDINDIVNKYESAVNRALEKIKAKAPVKAAPQKIANKVPKSVQVVEKHLEAPTKIIKPQKAIVKTIKAEKDIVDIVNKYESAINRLLEKKGIKVPKSVKVIEKRLEAPIKILKQQTAVIKNLKTKAAPSAVDVKKLLTAHNKSVNKELDKLKGKHKNPPHIPKSMKLSK